MQPAQESESLIAAGQTSSKPASTSSTVLDRKRKHENEPQNDERAKKPRTDENDALATSVAEVAPTTEAEQDFIIEFNFTASECQELRELRMSTPGECARKASHLLDKKKSDRLKALGFVRDPHREDLRVGQLVEAISVELMRDPSIQFGDILRADHRFAKVVVKRRRFLLTFEFKDGFYGHPTGSKSFHGISSLPKDQRHSYVAIRGTDGRVPEEGHYQPLITLRTQTDRKTMINLREETYISKSDFLRPADDLAPESMCLFLVYSEMIHRKTTAQVFASVLDIIERRPNKLHVGDFRLVSQRSNLSGNDLRKQGIGRWHTFQKKGDDHPATEARSYAHDELIRVSGAILDGEDIGQEQEPGESPAHISTAALSTLGNHKTWRENANFVFDPKLSLYQSMLEPHTQKHRDPTAEFRRMLKEVSKWETIKRPTIKRPMIDRHDPDGSAEQQAGALPPRAERSVPDTARQRDFGDVEADLEGEGERVSRPVGDQIGRASNSGVRSVAMSGMSDMGESKGTRS